MPQHIVLDAVREAIGIDCVRLVGEFPLIVAMPEEIVSCMPDGMVQILNV